MESIISFLSSFWHIILTVLGFGFIIFVHELGHFIMAKRAGVKVDKFFIGFDIGNLKIFSFTRKETEYGVGILPFGGYVKLHGYEELPGHETEIKDISKEHFHSKTVGERFGVMVGGVAMNFLSAIFLILLMYGIGKEYTAPIVGDILSVTAVESGLKENDIFQEVNGEPVKTFLDVRKKVMLSSKGEPIQLKVKRGDKIVELNFIPDIDYENGVPELPIIPQRSLKIRGIYEGSPASLAGLLPGDILETVNGEPLHKFYDFEDIVTKKPNEKIQVGFKRGDTNMKFDLTTSKLPSYLMTFESGLSNNHPLEIETVTPDSAASKAGLKTWDKIISINGKKTYKVEDIGKVLNTSKDASINLEILRGDTTTNVSLNPLYNKIEHRYMIGIRTSLSGMLGKIENVEMNGPAYVSGLRINDRIISINNVPISSVSQMRQAIHLSYGKTISLQYERDENNEKKIIDTTITLRVLESDGFFTKLYRKVNTLITKRNYILDPFGMGLSFQKDYFLSTPAENSPAALAGFKEGDRLLEVSYLLPNQKKPTNFKIDKLIGGWNQIDMIYSVMASRMSLKDGKITNQNISVDNLVLNIKYERDGKILETALIPKEIDSNLKGYSGIEFADESVLYRYSTVAEAFNLVYTESLGMLEFTVSSFSKLITGNLTTNALSGPFGIIPIMHQVAKSGIVEMLWVVAMLSVNIGFLNLLPFPPLDGGAIFFLIIEKIKGSPVSARFQVLLANIGVIFLIGLMVFVTMNDISRFFG